MDREGSWTERLCLGIKTKPRRSSTNITTGSGSRVATGGVQNKGKKVEGDFRRVDVRPFTLQKTDVLHSLVKRSVKPLYIEILMRRVSFNLNRFLVYDISRSKFKFTPTGEYVYWTN